MTSDTASDAAAAARARRRRVLADDVVEGRRPRRRRRRAHDHAQGVAPGLPGHLRGELDVVELAVHVRDEQHARRRRAEHVTSSCERYEGSRGFTTAPTMPAATATTTVSYRLGSCTETTSPAATPCAVIHAASERASRSSRA